MDFAPQPNDGFYRRLNPRRHFVPRPDGQFRISSVAFKEHPAEKGWKNSVDWSVLTPLEVERELRDEMHPGWGLGEFPYRAVDEESLARIEHDALPGNPGHSLLFVESKGAARAVARQCGIVELPSLPIEAAGGES